MPYTANAAGINTAPEQHVVSDRSADNCFFSREKISELISDRDNIVILPGFVDVHVHLREPGFSYKETIYSGSRACAHGGYTAVCAMPNLSPVPDSLPHLREELDIIERDAAIRVLPYGAITRGEAGGELSDMDELAPYVVAFSDDGRGVQTDGIMREAMLRAASLGKLIVAHCEDNSLLRGGYIHDGEYARAHGHRGICSESEWRQIERDLGLVRETGCGYHVCHISTAESVRLIREAKREGLNVTAETAPHYLLLDERDMQEDGRFKMNPPLRTKEDLEALRQGLKDDVFDVISTDHAPHALTEKQESFKKAPFGIVGLETSVALTITELVDTEIITPMQMAEKMSYNPAKILHLDKKGSLAPGMDADVVVIDPEAEYVIDPKEFVSKGKNTPFGGKKVKGKVMATVCGGKIVYEAE